MAGILDFLDDETKNRRTKKFEERFSNSDEGDKRKLEKEMLKPEKLKHYTGPKPRAQTLADRSVKIIFPNDELMEIFKKHFRVTNSKFVEKSVPNIKLLISFLRKLESKEITYDKKTGQIDFCHCEGSPPLGTGK